MASTSPEFDAGAEERRILEFIKRTVRSARTNGVVLGLSGGVDSSVVCALCVRALGPRNVLAVLMPSSTTPSTDNDDAMALATSLGIDHQTVPIGEIVDLFSSSTRMSGTRLAGANLQARTRMVILYFFANSMNRIVAGTGDRSESEIGYFTKFGDGGVDFLPIGHLYKTQVRIIGNHMGLPGPIVEKLSSPRLWPGHKATDEIPVDYPKLDVILHSLIDLGSSESVAAAASGVDVDMVKRVRDMRERSAHKRSPPPKLEPPRTLG